MFALTMFALLAAAAPEPGARIPGTWLRLGMTESRALELGKLASIADAGADFTARQGDSRFFGVPCQATLHFREGRLARARLEAADVSPHALDYIEGQLRRLGLRRRCLRDEPGLRVCDWLDRALRVRLEISRGSFTAQVDPLPGESAARSGSGEAATGPAGAVGDPHPSAGTGSPAAARDAGAEVAPRDTAVAVATLPETLSLSLPARNSPDDWPRIIASPPLDYPAGAGPHGPQGVVWVLALVEEDGRVLRAGIERGIRGLDEAAAAWVSGSRFAPCRRRGQSCRFLVRVAVRFALP